MASFDIGEAKPICPSQMLK
jgi:hypothetical protein